MTAKRILLLLLASVALATFGAGQASAQAYCTHVQTCNPLIYETNCTNNVSVNTCADGLDNDGDGFVDLADSGCAAEGRLVVPTAPGAANPGFFALQSGVYVYNGCNDGTADNDSDGYVNAVDPDCIGEFACQDGIDNDCGGGTDGADLDCQCIVANTAPNYNCTANDVRVAFTVEPLTNDGCLNSNDTLEARFFASLTAGPNRYDIGMWFNLDGNTTVDAARLGTLCARQILKPHISAVNAAPGGGAITLAPTDPDGRGPFRNLESADDRCGDIIDEATAIDAIYLFETTLFVPCTDNWNGTTTTPDGYVDVGQCGSWENQSSSGAANDPHCFSLTNAIPSTPSKCSCGRANTPIPRPNSRLDCTNFSSPSFPGGTFDPGETAVFTVGLTNNVACTNPVGFVENALGSNGCGSAAFVRMTINYGTADTVGDFSVTNSAAAIVPVPTCPTTEILASNLGVICNDTANNRLIWAPRDPTTPNQYTVIGDFGGTLALPVRYTLTDSNTTSVSLNTSFYWDATVDTTAPIGSISAAEAVDLTGANLQVFTGCANCACSSTVSTTPITLASFEAREAGGAVFVDWTTATEVGNVGFNVYAETPKGQVKLNDKLIPASPGKSLEPKAYSASFARPESASGYYLEDVDFRGRGKMHGRYEADRGYGAAMPAMTIDWQQGAGRKAAPALGEKAAGSGPAGPASAALGVRRDGIYRVTYEELVAAGFDFAGVNANQLQVTVGGVQVPIYVSASGAFGPGRFIEFIGRGLDTLYTDENVYVLSRAPIKGTSVATSKATAPAVQPVASYVESRAIERNLDYAYWSPLADPFFDTLLWAFGGPNEQPIDFAIDGYLPSVGAATLRVELYGAIAFPTNPDHHVRVKLNGTSLGSARFDGLTAHTFTAAIPAGVLREGANTLALELPNDNGGEYDLVNLESWTVVYPRAFMASENRLGFAAAGSRFEVGGLSSGNAVAYRLEGSAVTRLNGTQTIPVGGGFAAVVPGSTTSAQYFVAAEAALLKPAIRAARIPSGLLAGPATYLVISHADFLGGLAELVNARRAQGLSVKVVDVADLYAQYTGGVVDAQAIRRYIADAARSMGTRYVLIAGGDSYDYRNYLGLGSVAHVPSLYLPTSEIVRFTPSDSALADLDGDNVQDLAIGRLPVRTVGQLSDLLRKIAMYEAKDYGRTGVFAADFTDADASVPFSAASDGLIGLLTGAWSVETAYLDNEDLATARQDLLDGLNGGVTLATWVGHSGPSAWGTPGGTDTFFTVADAGALTNVDRPAVVAQWGCWNTYYSSPRFETLGNQLLIAGNRGAAAVMGATTLTEDAAQIELGRRLAPLLSTPGLAIGDAIVAAKQALARDLRAASSAPAASRFGAPTSGPVTRMLDVFLGWNYLGDPYLAIEKK